MSNPEKPNLRLIYTGKLAQQFIADYSDIIPPFSATQKEEIILHLIDLIETLKIYCQNPLDDIYQAFVKREQTLFKHYGQILLPYYNKKFYSHFWLDAVLVEKEIITSKEFNALPSEEQCLSIEEVNLFAKTCNNFLQNELTFHYLHQSTQESPKEIQGTNDDNTIDVFDEKDKTITKSKQLLAIYFLLKSEHNVDPRTSHEVAPVAKLAHLLTGSKISNIQNSDIYKKFLEMPNFTSELQLIKNLKFIRPYFEALQLKKVIELIDIEMANAESTLPLYLKNKVG